MATTAAVANQNDLDSSNVLYDADFEIEEHKADTSADAFPQSATTLFNP